MAMNDVFKENYYIHVFCLICKIEPKWELQVLHLHEYWTDVGKLIVQKDFFRLFTKECEELNLPSNAYDIEAAFEKANKEWCIELMIAVADRLILWYDDDVAETDEKVTVEDGRIKVDPTFSPLLTEFIERTNENAVQ